MNENIKEQIIQCLQLEEFTKHKIEYKFKEDNIHIFNGGFNCKIPYFEFQYSNVPFREIIHKYMFKNCLFKNGWHEWEDEEI